jgi:transposase
MPYANRFVGIDISKSFLDVCLLPDQERARFANTSEGIASFIAYVSPLEGIERLILEPTGATSVLS